MNISEKYLEALKTFKDWTTVSEWAKRFGELYPDLLEKAHKEALEYRTPSNGLREIAARISSNISRGTYIGRIDVKDQEQPRKIKLLSEEEIASYEKEEIQKDIAPIKRADKIRADSKNLGVTEEYRISEFEAIAYQLRYYFDLDFEFEHAKALLNPTDPGTHHPDNIQILLRSHNRQKSSQNWPRFTLEEQIEYIKAVVKVQEIVSSKVKKELKNDVINSILERLKAVY